MSHQEQLGGLAADFQHYEVTTHSRLGAGQFGSVYRWRHKPTGTDVAAKCLKAEIDPDDQNIFLRELLVLAHNNHPGTLRLLGYSFASPPEVPEPGPVLITPLMQKGTLQEILKLERTGRRMPDFTPTVKSKVVFGIAAAMAYMHDRDVLHRDLKAENVFLDDNHEPVVADFGLSREFAGGIDITMGPRGTPLYMAPELFMEDPSKRVPYDYRIDVYAYAMLIYMLFCPEETPKMDRPTQPRSREQLLMFVSQGTRYVRLPNIPDYYWRLINACWKPGWESRPHFKDIVREMRQSHEYVFPGTNMPELLEYEDRMLDFRGTDDRPVDEDFERNLASVLTAAPPAPASPPNAGMGGLSSLSSCFRKHVSNKIKI
jgi:serine/threonine protein kinase